MQETGEFTRKINWRGKLIGKEKKKKKKKKEKEVSDQGPKRETERKITSTPISFMVGVLGEEKEGRKEIQMFRFFTIFFS